MAGFALERVAEGFGTVKVKIGQSHERDVEAVRRVREAVGGDIRVRVDANMSFTDVAAAIKTITAIEPFSPELLEQPVKPKELDAMDADPCGCQRAYHGGRKHLVTSRRDGCYRSRGCRHCQCLRCRIRRYSKCAAYF